MTIILSIKSACVLLFDANETALRTPTY